MMKNIYHAASLIYMIILVCISAVHAQSRQAILNQYTADLRKNPNDYALREKIIKHVQMMKPAPPIPREAERFMNRGVAAMKSAKDVDDFKDAVVEFEKATILAPWLANAYYNLGVAQDKAGMYSSAIKSLKLYLVAAPNAPDTKSVEKLIDEIEYRQEKVAQTQIKARTEEKKKGLKDLAGNWYRKEPYDHRSFPYDSHSHYRAEMRGEVLVFVEIIDVAFRDFRKGQERDFFLVSRLEGNRLIGKLHHYEGTLEMTVRNDYNELELILNGAVRKTYTRR